MSSTNPPDPFPLNPIFNDIDWFSGLKVNFSLQELQQYFLLKSGDIATGLITFSSGLSCDGSILLNGVINIVNGENLAYIDAINYSGNANTSITANNCLYIFITPNTVGAKYLIPFTNVDTPTNDYLSLQTTQSGNFWYNPDYDQLQVGTIRFSGGGSIDGISYSGSVATATNASFSTTIQGTASASNVNYSIAFMTTGTGPKDLYNASTNNFYYNPSTQTCTALNFSGNFVGTSSAANQIVITTTASNTIYYIPFMNSNTSGAKTIFGDTANNLQYNPATQTLTVQNLTVLNNLTATQALSTNANNILINPNNINTNYNILMCTNATATYQSVICDQTEQLLYNPNIGALTLGGTTNGSINILGTASTITINNTSSTAISAPTATTALSGRSIILNTTQGTNNGSLVFNDITTSRQATIILNNATGVDTFQISPSVDNAISLNFGQQVGGASVNAYTNIFSYAVTSHNFYIGLGASPSARMNINTNDVTFPKPINAQGSIVFPTTTNLASFVGTTMTLTGPIYNVSKYAFNYNFTGGTNNLNLFTITNMPDNGEWVLNIYNGGTGNLNFNQTVFGAGFKIPQGAGNLNVSPLGYCIVSIQKRNFNASSVFIVNATILV